MTLNEVFKYLVEKGYVLASKDKGYTLSKKFQADVKAMKASSEHGLSVVSKSVSTTTELDWGNLFINFIKDAEVPAKLPDNKGGWYAGNKYSEDAMKKFKQIIGTGIDYNLLVRSTQLYYKSANTYKKIISNYILDGDWRTDYFTMKDAVDKGVQGLVEHVKTETDDGQHSNYRIG